MTWEWWAGKVEDSAVSVAGRLTLDWAIDVIRGFFGEAWLADNAARTGYVPLLSHLWWPPKNIRAVTRILELAARIALVAVNGANSDLLGEAQTIYSSRDLAGTKFEHLCLVLEVAAFAALEGWSVSYEEPSATGRRPDLTITRNSVSYAVELTRLGLDREFRAIERYCDELKSRLRYFEHKHQVELVCNSAEVLGERDLSAWLAETGQACERTAADGRTRTVAKGGSEASVFPTGQRPAGRVFTGPVITGDVWRRVAIRIGEKAQQTTGSAAWLRIDDTGALLRFTDRSTQPLDSLLADLQLNVAAALAGAPHVRGVILSGGTMIDPGNAQDATAWEQAGRATLITPGLPRHALANGPAAVSRALPGGRSRLTFILPNPRPHLVLPAGLGLEPGLWYHDEPSWLSRALQSLGHPPLAHLIPS